MCGIAGILGINGKPVDAREVRAMCDVMVHRGPDDEGCYVKGNAGLGMRRLSIIDIATGRQPVHNEDGSVQVVQNGEIYNYRELRRELERSGHTFYTATDTEVIVHLYEEHGVDFVRHLRGMFAIAVWDEPRGKLVLARDRLGIKPLYYGEIAGRLVFASELKAIMQLPWVKRDLNWNAVGNLLTSLTTPGDESIIQGIRKLEPGHVLMASAGRPPAVYRYWDVEFRPDHRLSERDCVEGLRSLLDESVRMHMVSDVPLGGFLSGGIDSSAVIATMARHSPNPVKTFSIGFPETEYNETPYARQVAEAFGTDHHELILEPGAALSIEDLAWHLDEPFGDSSALPTWMVSRLAAEHVTVALSGDGGDELFAGYDKYLVERRERRYRYIPSVIRGMLGTVGAHMTEGMKGRRFLRHIALDGAERYLHACTLFDREEQDKLLTDAAAERLMSEDRWRRRVEYLQGINGHWLSRLQYNDLHNYLPQDILTKVDRMSMAHSLEVRVPLLDHKVVEFAAAIPPAYRMRGGSSKHIFKKAMRGILPDTIIDRPKRGFAVPLGRWFRGELSGQVRDLLLSESSRSRNIFNHTYVEKLLSMHGRGRPLDMQLWTLVSFELWCRTFLDAAPGPVRRVTSRPEQASWTQSVATAGVN